jgi:putative Holliday junction resolvase
MPDPRTPPAAPQLVLAFDFGLRRIGIAVGDTLTGQARPLPPILLAENPRDSSAHFRRIETEVRALAPARLVVGLPYNVDGSPTAMTPRARSFAADLERRFGLPVHLVDERYSSLEADARLAQRRAGGARRSRAGKLQQDGAAAAVIFERWIAGEGED